MTALLVMTVGQSDVQLVVNDQRHKLNGNSCGTLHDAIKERSWSVVDAPRARSRDLIKTLPEGDLQLCTPKLDAVLAYFGDTLPLSALIFETNRRDARDPRLGGHVMERRLRDRGISQVTRVAFLTGTELLEDPSNNVDAVVRQAVVAILSNAVGEQVKALTKDDRVFVATTGGLAAANELINELVRLHAVGGLNVTALEVPDGHGANQDDRAVEEKFHPAAGYRARWHALSLVEKGNLLGAWGAVGHLDDTPGQEWTKVVRWLADFASSLPMPGCDLPVLTHQRMAVRAALRVELALRAGDIPRAIHGTVAFFEAALWDHLVPHIDACSRDPRGRRICRLKALPPSELCSASDGINAFRQAQAPSGQPGDWYYVEDSDKASRKLSDSFLKKPGLSALCDAVTSIRELRNDVAHNEPTPELMNDARQRIQLASLWSDQDAFLSQPLIQEVLRELGEQHPEGLCDELITTVRARLLKPCKAVA